MSKEEKYTHVALPTTLFHALIQTMAQGKYPDIEFSKVQGMFKDVEKYAVGITINQQSNKKEKNNDESS